MFPRISATPAATSTSCRRCCFLTWSCGGPARAGPSQANYYQNDSRVYTLPAYQVLDITLTTGGLPLLGPDVGTRISVSGRNTLSTDYIEPGFAGVDIPQPDTTVLFQLQQAL